MKRTVRYLLDTDTCIYLLNGVERLKMHYSHSQATHQWIWLRGNVYFGYANRTDSTT